MTYARTFIVPLAGAVCALALTVSSGEITPRWNGDVLKVNAPKVHFLTGKSLERLKNGASVPFDFQLTLSAGNKNAALARALERFVVSYDLWEERFTVFRVGGARKSGVHLTAAAAEAWCLENLMVPSTGAPKDGQLWLKLEIRTAEPPPAAPSSASEGGISLATLIEVFSRPTGSTDHWQLETGPFKLEALRR